MNPVHTFAAGFITAAIATLILSANIFRAMLKDTRDDSYAEGYDAGRAGVRRELANQSEHWLATNRLLMPEPKIKVAAEEAK